MGLSCQEGNTVLTLNSYSHRLTQCGRLKDFFSNFQLFSLDECMCMISVKIVFESPYILPVSL